MLINHYHSISCLISMAIIPETFEMFTKREDDEGFQEFLLNNHQNIIDSKEGSEKILYSMEISRILGRVAVHERCLAEEIEKRPINRKKYDLYNKTSLYVARRGIDIGTKMEYGRHEQGDDIPDACFNHHMGWLYVQYCMNLHESKRYFAAMEAIDRAETYLRLDLALFADSRYQDKFIKELKSVPLLKDLDFNVPRNKLESILRFAFDLMYQDLYYVIIEKKIRILGKIYRLVPGDYMDMYAGYIVSLFSILVQGKKYKLIQGLAPLWKEIKEIYPEKPKNYLDIEKLSEFDIGDNTPEEVGQYRWWCNSAHLLLTFLDFVPFIESRYQYCCDDLTLDAEDVDLKAMFEDVTETFAHCRYLMYSALTDADPKYKIAYAFSPKAKRVHNQEVLMDMYSRLYAVLDKTSHIVIKTFGITLMPKDGAKYPPQPSYNQIVKELRNSSMDNPYLMTLCDIYDEINPRNAYREYGDLPFYSMLPEAEHMDSIRHHIVHSGFYLSVEETGNRSNKDVAYVRERDFSNHCCSLLSLVKEAIMNTFLAIEYKGRRTDKLG